MSYMSQIQHTKVRESNWWWWLQGGEIAYGQRWMWRVVEESRWLGSFQVTSNICFPLHLCYSKRLLQLDKCHPRNQSISLNDWFPKPHFINSNKKKRNFPRTSHFKLLHNHTSDLCPSSTMITLCIVLVPTYPLNPKFKTAPQNRGM